MRGIRVILGAGLLLLAGRLPGVLAQDKVAPSHEYKYDTAKQLVVEGVVEEVKDYQCPVTGTVGSHITVKQASGVIEVHLAPATFMKKYEIVINKGDRVAVQGAKIVFEGKPALLAKTVAVDTTTYAFRGPEGKPLW
jgi:DNA/RNA endonuclease YhcR with UshA esterase domain